MIMVVIIRPISAASQLCENTGAKGGAKKYHKCTQVHRPKTN